MIYIGTDIIQLSRIDELITAKGKRFLSHIYTEYEQSICNKKKSPYIHYGGKYAAKEAVKKALLSLNKKHTISLKNIEIKNKDDGAPMVILKDDTISSVNVQVSISHTDDYATATAILEIK